MYDYIDQIARGQKLENQLLIAMRQRILEHVWKLENFVLTLIPNYDIQKSHFLSKEAIDMPRASSKRVDLRDASVIENCLIFRVDKAAWDMVIMKFFKQFFSHCIVRYVYSKLQTSQLPIQSPQIGCKHYMSAEECKSFLPDNCFEASLIQKGCIVLSQIFLQCFTRDKMHQEEHAHPAILRIP